MTLFEIFKKTILSPTEVIQKAIQEKVVPPNDSPEYIKENFSQLVCRRITNQCLQHIS
jgi:hypothetical protein